MNGKRDFDIINGEARIAQRLNFDTDFSDEDDDRSDDHDRKLSSSTDFEDSFEERLSPPGFTFHRSGHSPRKPCSTRSCLRRTAPSPDVDHTPPYKRVLALQLVDQPQTPKTLGGRNDLMDIGLNEGFGCDGELMIGGAVHTPTSSKSVFLSGGKGSKPMANINPFTPTGMLLHQSGQKRRRSERSLNGSLINTTIEELMDEDDEDEITQPTKKLALRESNISRYQQEFLEIDSIGKGEFGFVYKCINRLDGCMYALKKSLKPVAGSSYEQTALNEVWAHAVLGRHIHVLRYYSAWAEDNHMFIQNEYCNGGSLADVIEENQQQNRYFTEPELKQILLHISEGLKYIHSMHLAHMDIKPGNIFITKNTRAMSQTSQDSADDGFEEDCEEEETVYKIGDLGHVTSLINPRVEEGDCRYLPREILQENYTNLTKADVFALGLTIYEAGGGCSLPKNGDQWQDIRLGNLPYLDRYSDDMNNLLKQMINPDPEMRPSASVLIQHRVLCPFANKTKAQLRKELNSEKLRNESLSRQLEQVSKCLSSSDSKPVLAKSKNQLKSTSTRSVGGGKKNRSVSVTNF